MTDEELHGSQVRQDEKVGLTCVGIGCIAGTVRSVRGNGLFLTVPSTLEGSDEKIKVWIPASSIDTIEWIPE